VDRWAEWLLRRRFGGAEISSEEAAGLAAVRDRVLDNARLQPGARLLDVGAGDGLIAFGALERGAAEVVFCDISDDLLARARELAAGLGVLDRCSFVHASAEDLSPFEDGSFDAVTTRSVLIYVERKRQALAEFHRVVRPGGRISLFEPINRFGARFRVEETLAGYPLGELGPLAAKLRAVYGVERDDGPMLGFDERDLLELAVAAGFLPVELHLNASVVPHVPQEWERFAATAGNPNIPTLAEAMDEALSPDERDVFTRHLRPLVERGDGVGRSAVAYLVGTRPSD
jgi:SAM-dependent methyltransferase